MRGKREGRGNRPEGRQVEAVAGTGDQRQRGLRTNLGVRGSRVVLHIAEALGLMRLGPPPRRPRSAPSGKHRRPT